MARTNDQWVTIISQLLKKAEKTDSEAEAATFFAQANALMLKHAIDEAKVRDERRATEGSKVESPVQVYWMWATHDAHAKAKETLLYNVARSQHVVFANFPNKAGSNTYREGNSGRYSQWGSLVGYEQDIENTKLLFTSMLIQWSRFMRPDVKARRDMQGTEGEYGYKTGHLEGFARRVGVRLQDQEREVVAAANANALMINKDAEISAWLKSKETPKWYDKYCLDYSRSKNSFCGLLKGHGDEDAANGKKVKHDHTIKAARRSGGSRDVDYDGYRAGSAAGSQADLGTPRTKIGG